MISTAQVVGVHFEAVCSLSVLTWFNPHLLLRWLVLPHKRFTRFVFSPLAPELAENWTDTRETLLEGMTFNIRHLGMTLVDQPKGEELSATAVKRIVATVSSVI